MDKIPRATETKIRNSFGRGVIQVCKQCNLETVVLILRQDLSKVVPKGRAQEVRRVIDSFLTIKTQSSRKRVVCFRNASKSFSLLFGQLRLHDQNFTFRLVWIMRVPLCWGDGARLLRAGELLVIFSEGNRAKETVTSPW